jgi:hypothetical protein
MTSPPNIFSRTRSDDLPCDCEERDPMTGDYDPVPDPTWWQQRRANLAYLALACIALGFLATCVLDLYNRWGVK